jgi:predicted nucleic acid-binding protein
MRTLIDTRILILSFKFPYLSIQHKDYPDALQSKSFVEKIFQSNETILISSQLAAEIFHVLVNRGIKIPPAHANKYLNALLNHKNVEFKSPSKENILKAIELSASSGIHIWDYLVVLPFENGINRIITMDPHFNHPSLSSIARIENPINIWKTEGND